MFLLNKNIKEMFSNMYTEEEFNKRWKRLTDMQKKFCLRYIENGFSAKEAAYYARIYGRKFNNTNV